MTRLRLAGVFFVVAVLAAQSASARAWSIQRTPSPASYAELTAVSCASSTACTSVGDAIKGGVRQTLAEGWHRGRWSLQRSANPRGARFGSELLDVSCTSPLACTAVGDYAKVTAADGRTLAERWNGRTWKIQSTPSPGKVSGYLTSVTCVSNRVCVAVGYTLSETGKRHTRQRTVTLIERWNGKVWSIQPSPNPAGSQDAELHGISCTSSHACTAVGHFARDSLNGPVSTLVERWNGKRWLVQSSPNVGSAELADVSCAAQHMCVAVGSDNNGLSEFALVERWDGARWVVQPSSSPSGDFNDLAGVSCVAITSCTAVGDTSHTSSDGTVASGTLVERWNGMSWSVDTAATPPGATSSGLRGVSCTASVTCTAVGSYGDPHKSVSFTFAERS